MLLNKKYIYTQDMLGRSVQNIYIYIYIYLVENQSHKKKLFL